MFKLNPELKLGWGSNLLGQGIGKRGAGQAEFAGELGAVYGQGRGAAGRTFAIPTKTAPAGRARTIHEIQPDIRAFGEHVKASDNPWFLAAIGTGRGRGVKSVDQASKDIANLVQDEGLFELGNLAVSKKLLNSINRPQNPLGIKLYESIASKNWHPTSVVIPREAIAESIKTTKKINTSFKGSMNYPIKGKSTIKSRTTFDAITAGERTMTTRRVGLGWENRKVGEVFPIKGKGSQTQLIEITHEPTIHTVTGKESQAFLNRWSQLEGHGPEQFHQFFSPGQKLTMVKFKPATSGTKAKPVIKKEQPNSMGLKESEMVEAKKRVAAMTPQEIAALDDPIERAMMTHAQKHPEFFDEMMELDAAMAGQVMTKKSWGTMLKWARTEGHPMKGGMQMGANAEVSPIKVISGMQIGADQIGLRVAKAAGLKTGGTAPPRFQTSHGKNPQLAKEYGIVEGAADPDIYKLRTLANVKNSDGTIIVATDWKSGGTKLTQKYLKQEGKPSLLSTDIKEPWDIVNWMQKHDIQTINIAGNRKVNDKHPAWMHILNAFKEMKTLMG